MEVSSVEVAVAVDLVRHEVELEEDSVVTEVVEEEVEVDSVEDSVDAMRVHQSLSLRSVCSFIHARVRWFAKPLKIRFLISMPQFS